ncbi:MAG TPA: CARDB domain-containing protein, partial [Terriglobales bacterium]|nr:CARDB domain-containing protein [Terriglobales bacterium]
GLATVTIPLNTAAGSYYLIACADQYSYVKESDETNNCLATATPLPMGMPDLLETSITALGPLAAGAAVQVSDTVLNQGAGNAAASYVGYYLSSTPTKTGSSVQLGANRSVPALAAGASSSGLATVTIPLNTAAGSYYLIACADQYSYVKESDETNNCLATPLLPVAH